MNASSALPESQPLAVLQDLMQQHGRLSVLVMAVKALLRRNSAPVVLTDAHISDHMRRDIGLSQQGAPHKGWERYR